MNLKINNKGFTLLEVIIYIALFSLLMGTAFATAYQLIADSGKLSVKATIQEEGNFVMRKINWALTGITNDIGDITSPQTVSPYAPSDTLSIKKWVLGTKVPVEIEYDAVNFSIAKEGAGPSLPITTENVKVTNLQFQFIPESGSGPAGITATATITKDGVPFLFTITKYIRK